MPVADELLANNEQYAAGFDGPLPGAPARHIAVLACMDARLDVLPVLGLANGDAHVIRNAGGIVTDDAIRSLVISQRLLGTTEIVLLHHTECGMMTFSDDELADAIEADTGVAPPWSAGAFPDLDADLRESLDRVRSSVFLPHRDAVRGFVFDVATGRLREVL